MRLAVAVALLAALGLARRLRPASRAVAALRDVVPFVACILIYTNLHDTIGFVNGHDVHHFLDALDRELFGVQPTVWAERFITPARTEVMQFLYLNFFWIAPVDVAPAPPARSAGAEFRAVTLGVIVCFYLGYLLYVVFPAAPPRLVLVYEFKRSLAGHPSLFSNLSARAFELLPVDSRAAFPSLHAAVSLVVLIYAWRHLRAWFFLLLPFVLGLWTSTIYLRHHYTVDVLAGWMLAPVAVALAPRLDAWWNARRRALGAAVRRRRALKGRGPDAPRFRRLLRRGDARRPAMVAPGELQRGAFAAGVSMIVNTSVAAAFPLFIVARATSVALMF